MKKTTKQLEKEEIEADLKEISKISVIGETEGGQVLLKSLLTDIATGVNTICHRHSTMTVQEFVSIAALMKANVDLYCAIGKAKKNKEYLQTLLAEALLEQ
jgi:hypothetical protein